MAYCTAGDVRLVLARDSDDVDGTAGEMGDDDIVDAQISSAAAEVDARLAGRYQVPFAAPAPGLVKSLTVDVAAYLATLTYRQGKDLQDTDPVVRRYQRALAILTQLSTGVMDLPSVPPTDDDPGGPVAAGVATVRNPYEGFLFGMDDFGLGYDRGRIRDRGW